MTSRFRVGPEARPGMTSSLPRTHQSADIRHLRLPDRGRRPRETRRRRGLGYAVAFDKDVSRGHMRVLRRFRHGEDRRKADVGAFHDLGPLGAALALEY